MTDYEHAMLGINGALAAGLHRRHGWPIVAWAGAAALIPDLDGLTYFAGSQAFNDGHRLWFHNLLVAGLLAPGLSALVYQTDALPRLQRGLARRRPLFALSENTAAPARGPWALLLWIVVGILAAYSHLLTDAFFSAGHHLSVWGVPFGWPFSNRAWAYPLVPWGNLGVTLIFIASMFAMVRWPRRVQAIAFVSLLAAALYMVACGMYYRMEG